MLNIKIICIWKLKEKYLKDAQNEYLKRLLAYSKTEIIELDEFKCSQNPSQSEIDKVISTEGEKIIAKIPNNSFVFSMCIEGNCISSEDLAKKIEQIPNMSKSTVCFIIGGSFGLSSEVKKLSDFKLSLSKMTFPHQLARVVLLEQVYRAFQINNGGKYHK